MKIKVKDNQSLLDIAIQTAGSAEAAFALALVNDMAMSDDLTAGQELATVDVVDRDIYNYYTNKKLTPATAITATQQEEIGIFDETFSEIFE